MTESDVERTGSDVDAKRSAPEVVAAREHLDAYRRSVVEAAVADATSRLSARRELSERERAVLEALAVRVAAGTLPDPEVAVHAGADEARVARTVRHLFDDR